MFILDPKTVLLYLFVIICCLIGIDPVTAIAKDKDNISNTYIHAGFGISTFGPSIQLGAHYRPGQYSLNFRFLSSLSGNCRDNSCQITRTATKTSSGPASGFWLV